MKQDFCDFCGDIKNCNPAEKHHPVTLRNLLVDAGIIEDTYEAWNEWIGTSRPEVPQFKGLPLNTIWNVGGKFMLAKYVRSIL